MYCVRRRTSEGIHMSLDQDFVQDFERLLREIEQIYRRRFEEYVAVARGILHDSEAARDVVQEAFASAIAGRHRFERGNLDARLWRIVVNAALSARTQRLRYAVEPSEIESLPAADQSPRLDRRDVSALIASLPDRQRIAVFLRYYADLDYATIAEVLGTSVGTVSSTLHAAHRALRPRRAPQSRAGRPARGGSRRGCRRRA